MGRMTRRTPSVRINVATGAVVERPDTVAVEEPLEIRVDGRTVVSTMRLPGDDVDLAVGWLLAEGLIHDPDEIRHALHCTDSGPDGQPTFNVIELTRRDPSIELDLSGRRVFAMSSACGVCGSATIDTLADRGLQNLRGLGPAVSPQVLASLPDRLRGEQSIFDRTGGVHAVGLFEADGSPVVVREDVGRHNACDKALGWAARERGFPLHDLVLMLSGRASYELLQKAWVAGVTTVAAVSAPSSLAVELAERAGITLVGFVRPPTMVVYNGAERLQDKPSHADRAGGGEPGQGDEIQPRPRTRNENP